MRPLKLSFFLDLWSGQGISKKLFKLLPVLVYKKMPLHTYTPFFKSNNKIHIQSGETINDSLLNYEAEFHGIQRGATVSVF